MRNQSKAYFLAISAVLLWSTVATAFKMALAGMNFVNLLFVSSLVSFILLAIILFASGKVKTVFDVTLKSWVYSAIMGFLNPFLYYIILLKAYSILPAQIAQPLNYTWPVVLVFLSAPFLGHKITFKTIIALIICFSGVLVISLQGKWNLNISNPLGIVLAAGSSVVWSVFWLLNMKDKREETHKLFLNFLFGFIYIAIYLLLFEDFKIKDATSFFASVYVGIFEMGITFVLWLTALRLSSSPEKISSFVFLSPFLSIFFIAFFLHESIHISTVAGLCLIIAGIILSKTRLKSRS